jgi:hypothetical protein
VARRARKPFSWAESALSGVFSAGVAIFSPCGANAPPRGHEVPALRGRPARDFRPQELREGFSSRKVQKSGRLILDYAVNQSFMVGLKALAREKPRYGYRRLQILLLRRGQQQDPSAPINHKPVFTCSGSYRCSFA